MRILTVCGSARVGSLNRLLLDSLTQLAPAGMELDRFEHISELPFYNPDIESSPPLPPIVTRWRQAIRAADGLVIATPEYCHGLPGVVKNALEWASRPIAEIPLSGMSVAAFVATPSRSLGYRALVDLTRLLRDMCNYVVASPEVVISQAHLKLVEHPDGRVELADPFFARVVRAQLEGLAYAVAHEAGPMALAGITAYEAARTLS